MSIKATRALFPYAVDVSVFDEDGNYVSYNERFDFDECGEIPFMWQETMTAAEWVQMMGEEVLANYMEEGQTAEIEIKFYEDFESKSYDEEFYSSTCTIDSDLTIIQDDDAQEEQAEQEAKADDAPVLVCLIKKYGDDDYSVDFDNSMNDDPLFRALEQKHSASGCSVRGSLRDILREIEDNE